jgi:hypothetical protein
VRSPTEELQLHLTSGPHAPNEGGIRAMLSLAVRQKRCERPVISLASPASTRSMAAKSAVGAVVCTAYVCPRWMHASASQVPARH